MAPRRVEKARWSEWGCRQLMCEPHPIAGGLTPMISRSCVHLRCHGGLEGALRLIQEALAEAGFLLEVRSAPVE